MLRNISMPIMQYILLHIVMIIVICYINNVMLYITKMHVTVMILIYTIILVNAFKNTES